MKFIVSLYAIWRLLLFVPIIVAYFFIPFRGLQDFTNILSKVNTNSLLKLPILYPWANFDGVHYLSISGLGYITEGRFFPLYPLIISIFVRLFNAAPFQFIHLFSGLLISNLFFVLGLIILYKLLLLDYQEKIARSVIFFLLIFPTSFYFASIYSEGLFFLLAVTSFYLARQKKWFLAGLAGAFLSLTRLPGVLIFPAILYEFLVQEKILQFKKLIPIFLIPLGLVAYSFFNYYSWNDPFYFIRSHGDLSNSRSVDAVIFFPQTIFRYGKILTSVSFNQFEWWVAFLELGSFSLASSLLYMAWKEKVRNSYLIFSFFALLVPASTGTFSGLPRYILVLFPIFIAMALIKNKLFKIIYYPVSIVLLFILLMLFSRGYYIS